MVITSLKTGFQRGWSAKRMILIYFLANLFCGVVLALPLRGLLGSTINGTLLGEALGGRIDMNFFMDFVNHHSDFWKTWQLLAIGAAIFYLLTNIFLSGGALSVFGSEERYSTTLFWSGAAKYFGRFLRLWLMALPVFGIFFLIMFVEKGVTRLVFGADPYQSVTYWAGWVRTGLMGLAVILAHMFFDYARIYSVLHDENRMRRAWWMGLKFMFGNLGKAALLVVFIGLLGIVVMAIYNLLANQLAAANAFVVIMLILIQQAYMLFRMFMKLSTFAAQTAFYQAASMSAPAADTPSAASEVAGEMPEGLPA